MLLSARSINAIDPDLQSVRGKSLDSFNYCLTP